MSSRHATTTRDHTASARTQLVSTVRARPHGVVRRGALHHKIEPKLHEGKAAASPAPPLPL
uniref:Uncharacterized protein n=1 Tax=Solanum lycopersicum TaxID=4081 RepID=A0A494G8X5_SOLLC